MSFRPEFKVLGFGAHKVEPRSSTSFSGFLRAGIAESPPFVTFKRGKFASILPLPWEFFDSFFVPKLLVLNCRTFLFMGNFSTSRKLLAEYVLKTVINRLNIDPDKAQENP